ncbi:MAG: DUF2877 domain-containing protein [Oscillospiraceae bacterium]
MPKIISCSNFASKALSAVKSGTIHSVYNKTINILCGDNLLSLQSRGTPRSPLTLETNCIPQELWNMNIAPGIDAEISAQGIRVKGIFFDFDFASVWNANLTEMLPDNSAPERPISIDFLCSCLRELMPVGGFADLALPDGSLWKSSLSAQAASHILSRCHELLLSRNWDYAALKAADLLGLGEGLTPSGDDFLCGMLAATDMLGTKDAQLARASLVRELRPSLSKTNDISAAFLDCAINGYFSNAVISLACGGNAQSVTNDFSKIGHSSGADTLSGIIFLIGSLSILGSAED